MAKATALAAAVLMLAGTKPLAGGRSGTRGSMHQPAQIPAAMACYFVLTIAPYMMACYFVLTIAPYMVH